MSAIANIDHSHCAYEVHDLYYCPNNSLNTAMSFPFGSQSVAHARIMFSSETPIGVSP